MNFIMIAVLVLGAIALIAALVLFGVSSKKNDTLTLFS